LKELGDTSFSFYLLYMCYCVYELSTLAAQCGSQIRVGHVNILKTGCQLSLACIVQVSLSPETCQTQDGI